MAAKNLNSREMRARIDRMRRENRLPTLDAFMAAFHKAADASVTFDEERMQLARRIAAHVSPTQENLPLTEFDRKLLKQMGIAAR